MTLEQELRLSRYREVAAVDSAHGVLLVQDTLDQKFYVKKQLSVYNPAIYQYLLTHPIANTPRILLAEEDAGKLTVIEEYIPGDTLQEFLDREGTLCESLVLNITVQLCRILQDFHSCQPPIVNRDIKPSNLKLTADGTLKLLDLNAAKWSDPGAAKDTVLLGTRGYAAPEQYGFGPSSILTDIYAVGVLMNVMLTGVFPNVRIASGALGEVIRTCVCLSPAGRFQSIDLLLAALSGAQQPPSTDTHGWRRFLPPGFRSKNGFLWFVSSLGYLFLFWLGMTLEVEGAGTAELLLNRIAFTAAMLGIILFTGNYLNLQRRFPLTRSRHRLLRWLGVLLADVLILAAAVIALSLVITLFFP